jgi:hypothetical protein
MKKLLSHHELAILLLLFSAPGQVALTDPDAVALQQESLVEMVSAAPDEAQLRLTPEGAAVLRRLGMTKA